MIAVLMSVSEILNAQGRSLFAEGRCEEAQRMFQLALDLELADETNHFNLALAAMCSQDREAAKASLNEYLRLFDSDANAHALLGYALRQSGETEAAEGGRSISTRKSCDVCPGSDNKLAPREHGAWELSYDQPTGSSVRPTSAFDATTSPLPSRPREFAFRPVRPNPLRASTDLVYNLPRPASMELRIRDVSRRLVPPVW